MPYIPHTEADRQAMLAEIGCPSVDELFREIPSHLRVDAGSLNLPTALDEHRLYAHLLEISRKNVDLSDFTCFLGAGIYDRFIPASVGAIISRGEFLTAYTPYQPEASQGYLQTIYEFQSMVAELYGMDIANASMYDGATAMSEAAIMATAIKRRDVITVSGAVHPHYLEVMRTYAWSMGMDVVVLETPEARTDDYRSLNDKSACLVVQYPNFYGTIEDLKRAREEANRAGALLIVVADPVACGILPPPGSFGADIVVGEGQSIGVSMGLGGPLVGLFACKKEFIRQIPGRIVGRTKEVDGEKSGFVMTLRTREQDIRREKATSNICTNEALMALAFTVALSALGKNGLRKVAEGTVRNTQYAVKKMREVGFHIPDRKVFGEFVLELPTSSATVRDRLLEHRVLGGLPLGIYDSKLQNSLLVAVTEVRTKSEIDHFVQLLVEVTA